MLSKILYATNKNVKLPFTLRQWCRNHNIDIKSATNLNVIDEITENFSRDDLLISDRYPEIFPRQWLHSKKFLCVNVHPSLLPKHRGSYALFWSVMMDKKCGVSIHELTPELDGGDVFLQKEFEYTEDMTLRGLYHESRKTSEFLLLDLIEILTSESDLIPKPQEINAIKKHMKAQTEILISQLPDGWDTQISEARKVLGFE
jgi:methionyl-tRNA formyltransferase